MSEENKALIRRAIDAINAGNLAAMDETYSSDYVYTHPDQVIRGLEAYKQFMRALRGAFPDIRFTIEDQVAEGEKVAARWTASGTHRGEFRGVPPTGKRVSFGGIGIQRVVAGKIVEGWAHYDRLGMMQQLGAIPTPGQNR